MLKGWALAAAMTIIALSGCAGNEELQDFGVVEAPDLKSGYAFAFDTIGGGSFEATLTVDGELVEEDSQTIPFPEGPFMTMEILNTSFGPNGSFYLGATQFAGGPMSPTFGDPEAAIFGKIPVAIRKSDLAAFSVSTTQTQACDPGCRLATTSIDVDQSTSLDPYIDFPLEAGKTWQNVLDDGADMMDLDMSIIIDSLVTGKQSVEGPDGMTDAVRILHKMHIQGMEALEVAIKQEMEANGATDVVVDMEIEGTVESFYAESLQTIVREVVAMRATIDMGFTAEGQRFEGHFATVQDATVFLSAVALEEEPELSLAEVFGFLDGAEPVKNPGTEPLDQGSYTLRVTADKAEFNVEDDATRTFTVEATPSMTAGDTLRYTVSDAAGGLIDDGTGSEFEVDFDEAGLYQVIVQAVNEDGIVQAVDGMLVAADLDTTMSMTCGTVTVTAVPNSQTCTEVVVPITSTTGLQEVSITINADNPAAIGGTLEVIDGAGNSVTKEVGDGEGFTLSELETLVVDDGWTVAWHRDASLLEEASVSAVLDYGPETEAESSGDGMARMLQTHFDVLQTGLPLL